MATRHARTADKALNEKHATILKGLLRQPGNKYCADCKRKDPRWASWNLGLFVCIRCSGIHRSMGTHISKVKSVDLDTWVPDQVENMTRWGNERANKYWEANLKDKRPSESNIDMWIRAKYEQKRWAMRGPIPDPSTLGGSQESSVASEASSSPSSLRAERPKQQQQQQASAPAKPKASEFANLDAFLGSPTTTTTPAQPVKASSSPASQLQGADFFFGGSSSPAPAPAAPPKQEEKPKSKHNDLKSSILSLYNQTPAQSMPINNGGAGGYMNNMSNFQQQLSGLSLGGPSSGVIPQAPPGHSFQNVWASNTNPMQPTTAQNQLPQGGQFFRTPGNGNTASSTNIPPKTTPAHDAFADLLK
ncbi:putative GTPase activating protein for Arf-domain-containing protein [Zychaea mexicana]|uniref:putative GTPase activating protein for Arf-domain-containing protein n=1 Tax=Zychaea mexicana TaxID=64656 RepID=UPI0022FE74B8|nr:putative GTPase activating protein for Arf-domain-containing protein [Zychaea mexicana]KAI9484381.1 putative GTPase activating protein for Arf-domain-containing protein [Zychaea mexicana]